MRQNKLILLFKLLDANEFRLFYKFVRSIYFQNNENLVRLYEYLRKYYPDFPPGKVKKEKMFEKIFPGRAFNENTLAALMSKMVGLVKEYLLILDMRSNEFERKKRLTMIYGKRNQYQMFERGMKHMLKELEQEAFPNYQEYIDLYHSMYFHPQHNRYKKEDQSLEHLMDSLDHYFAITKLRYGIALKNKQRILSTPYEWRFLDAIEQELISLKTPDLFQLYQDVLALLDEEKDVDFETFERLLFEHLEHLPEKDQTLLYFSGLNYANRQVNSGNMFFSSVSFRWYQHGLKYQLLIKNQQIHETIFGNIVVTGCQEKEFEWVQNFITSYQIYLNEQIRGNVVAQNLAWLHFSRQEYNEALSMLMSHSFSDKYQPKIRLTIVRTLFELFLHDQSYYEVLLFQIKAFETFISRNKFFNKKVLVPYLNCIRITRSLATKISDRENKEEIRAWLKSQTESKSEIIASRWLWEKMQEL